MRQVGGRPVYVDFDTGAPKGSYRTADGKLWSKAVKQQAAVS
jgi:sugar lactone lactonase YvrE